MSQNIPSATTPRIERAIQWIRGESVLLDVDLALLYGIETRVLVQAVKRHRKRFPADFMFQLTRAEFDELKAAHSGNDEWGGRRYAPYAFTEQGVAMLSSVLNSDRAVDVNIEIMRAFVRFRRLLSEHGDLAHTLAQLERKYDIRFREVFDAIRALMVQEAQPRRQIGFKSPD